MARALWAGFVLVDRVVAGALGTAVWLFGTRALLGFVGDAPRGWRVALLTFPFGVIGFFLCLTAHLGIAGRRMSEETRVVGPRRRGAAVVDATADRGRDDCAWRPHLPAFIGRQWTWFQGHQTAVSSVLAAAWAALTGLGVVAGRSERTKTGEGNPILEWAGRVAPVSFVLGYLLILSTLIHRIVVVRPGALSIHDLEGLLQGYSLDVVRALAQAQLPVPADPTAWLDVASIAGQGVALGLAAWFVSWLVDLNQFSLHLFYRNRLVRCFLGAPRPRKANPFTGFDSDDDLALTSLGGRSTSRPYPIFNAALNLVGGKNLAWQQRKAASFVFTPGYCGFDAPCGRTRRDRYGYVHAYRRTSAHASDEKSLTVGLAMAISGAAASPNMGYHSSPTLSFLMTVFNVRLGWWLRNPSPKVETSWTGPHRWPFRASRRTNCSA